MILVGVKVSFGDVYIAAGSMLAIWSLMLMAVADKKYMIVPDQLIIVLMLSAIGFIPHYISYMEPLLGGLIAFGIMGAIALLGKIVFKRWALGGGDIKVYTALGIIFGWKGFAVIFVLATFASAIHYAYLLINGKAKKNEERPLIPYVFGGACLYLLILYPGINQIWL